MLLDSSRCIYMYIHPFIIHANIHASICDHMHTCHAYSSVHAYTHISYMLTQPHTSTLYAYFCVHWSIHTNIDLHTTYNQCTYIRTSYPWMHGHYGCSYIFVVVCIYVCIYKKTNKQNTCMHVDINIIHIDMHMYICQTYVSTHRHTYLDTYTHLYTTHIQTYLDFTLLLFLRAHICQQTLKCYIVQYVFVFVFVKFCVSAWAVRARYSIELLIIMLIHLINVSAAGLGCTVQGYSH